MVAWADRLRSLGAIVVPFDYPYMKAGRKAPDKQPALIAAHRAALEQAQQEHGPNRPVIFAGKSMGSRIGCHLAVELAPQSRAPTALVCFGYPLRAMGTGASRAAVLEALTTPILFLSGSRDSLCPLEDLAAVRPRMKAPNELFVVDGGDHSLAVRKRAAANVGQSQASWDAAVLGAVAGFLRGLGLALAGQGDAAATQPASPRRPRA